MRAKMLLTGSSGTVQSGIPALNCKAAMRHLLRTPIPALSIALMLCLLAVGCVLTQRDQVPQAEASEPSTPVRVEPSAAVVPRPDHVVVVVMENKHRSSVIGSPDAPFINRLAELGANMSASYGLTHPSQPNYIGAVLRLAAGDHQQRMPNRLGGRQPRPATARRRPDVRRLRRVHARRGLHRLRAGELPPQAQSVGVVRQPARVGQSAVHRVPQQLRPAADRRLRDTEHVQRHAQLLDPHRRRLAEVRTRRVRDLGHDATTACWSSPSTRTPAAPSTRSRPSSSARRCDRVPRRSR